MLSIFWNLRRFGKEFVGFAKQEVKESLNESFHGRWFYFVALLPSTLTAAEITFSTNTPVPLPIDANYSAVVNIRPGDGTTQSNNPPLFSWFYSANPAVTPSDNPLNESQGNPNGFYPHWCTQTNEFNLQITTTGDTGFASPVVNVFTPFNNYNFLGPFDTNTTRTFRWRVKYRTNGVDYATGAVRTFTIANGALPWDRSIFTNASYHATNGVHPIFTFRAGEEAAIFEYAQTNDAAEWENLTNYAVAGTNLSIWHQGTNWPDNAARSHHYFSGTGSVATNTDSTDLFHQLNASLPSAGNRVYSGVVADQYIASAITTNYITAGAVITNRYQILIGSMIVDAHLGFNTGGGRAVSIAPEVEISYDKTNWFFGHTGVVQSITSASNVYRWIVTLPPHGYSPTNSSVTDSGYGFFVSVRLRVATQTGNPDVTLWYGNDATSRVSYVETVSPKHTPIVFANAFNYADNIGAVLFMWRFSGDNRWTNASMFNNLLTNLNIANNWFKSPFNNYPMLDYGDSESPIFYRLIVAAYDWLHEYSNTTSYAWLVRTNALDTIRKQTRFVFYNDAWFSDPIPKGQLLFFPEYDYKTRTNGFSIQAPSVWKGDSSHIAVDRNVSYPGALAAGSDDAEIGFYRDHYLNHYALHPAGVMGWAGHHAGAYGYVDGQISLISRQTMSDYMLSIIAFPQMAWHRTDFFTRFPEWYARLTPFNMQKIHGPYGDGAPSGAPGGLVGYWWFAKNRGWDIAALTGSGEARHLMDLNKPEWDLVFTLSGEGGQSKWDLIPTRYHFSLPAPRTNTTLVMIYPEDGYIAGSSIPITRADITTNGFGFSFKASVRGDHQNHGVPSSGTFDIWFRGTQITDIGGGSLDPYGYHSESGNGPFINGQGTMYDPRSGNAGNDYHFGNSPAVASYGHFTHFTNYNDEVVYAVAELTAGFTNGYVATSNIATSVQRELVVNLPKNYWMIRDTYVTTSNSIFAFHDLIPWAMRYEASSAALDNEVQFTGDRYGSNSVEVVTNGLNFTSGNYADVRRPSSSRFNVKWRMANATNEVGQFIGTGQTSLGSGVSPALGTANTNTTLNPIRDMTFGTTIPDRAATWWVTNRVATTNYSILVGGVVHAPEDSEPDITRLGNETLVFTIDGVHQTNTFGGSYSGVSTYRFTAVSGGSPQQVGGTGSAIIQGAVIQGAIIK